MPDDNTAVIRSLFDAFDDGDPAVVVKRDVDVLAGHHVNRRMNASRTLDGQADSLGSRAEHAEG